MARSGRRLGAGACLWLVWGLSMISAVLFVILCLVTFADLAQVQHEPSAGDLSSQLNGALAATLMAPVLTAGLVIVSFLILVRKTWSRTGTDLSYGFLCAGYFFMCCFLIITGIVLTSNKHWTTGFEQSPFWSTSSTNAYVASYVLAFLTAGLFFATFAVLVGPGRHAVRGELTTDDLGLSDRLRTTPMSVGMTTPPAAGRGAAAPPAGPAAAGGDGAWGSV